MRVPSTKKSTLAKLATIFAIGFAVSLGLCGANFVAILSGAGNGGIATTALTYTAWIEVAGMAISAVGMLIVAFVGLFQKTNHRFSKPPGSPEDK